MTEPPIDAASDHGATTATPRWVKVAGIIALVVALAVLALLLTGGGEHGPTRHTQLSMVTASATAQP